MAKKKNVAERPANLEAALKQIEKDYGAGAIQEMGSKKVINVESYSTGSLTLDLALGVGGFPRGRIVEIYGPESSGKTTVCQHVIASAQKAGGVCAFIDVEHALDPVYCKNTGVDVDRLLISQPDCGEDALQIAETLILSNELAVVVVDSVAALVPRAEIEGQMGDSHVGLQARLMSQALRKLTAAVSKSNTCLIFTNQIREKIGVMFGSPETTAGGNALKFYASIRLDIRKREAIKDPNSEAPLGNRVHVKVVKNKMAPPFRQADFDILYPNGISYEGGLCDVAIDMGIISKKGSYHSFDGETIGNGRPATIQELMKDRALCAKIDKLVREKAKRGPENEEEEGVDEQPPAE